MCSILDKYPIGGGGGGECLHLYYRNTVKGMIGNIGMLTGKWYLENCICYYCYTLRILSRCDLILSYIIYIYMYRTPFIYAVYIYMYRMPLDTVLFAFLIFAEEGNSSNRNVQNNIILASVNFLFFFLPKFLTCLAPRGGYSGI